MFCSFAFRISLIFFAWISLVAAGEARKCNGYAELCDRSYNNNTYLMSHNSFAYQRNVASTQSCPPTMQLQDGIRGIKLASIRANASSEEISVCHTSCVILDAGKPRDILSGILDWIKNNPNEVITIMWSNQGNFESRAFLPDYEASGILDYTHIQEPNNQTWPTLGEMIDSGKRVVNFIDGYSNQTDVPWMLDQFAYVFETPYQNLIDMTHRDKLPHFECRVDRPDMGVERAQGAMYVMNHFVYGTISASSLSIQIPQEGLAAKVNNESLVAHINNCTSVFQRKPNFLEVDYYHLGDALGFTAQLNNVSYQPSPLQCGNYIYPDSATSGSSPLATTILTPFTMLVIGVWVILTMS